MEEKLSCPSLVAAAFASVIMEHHLRKPGNLKDVNRDQYFSNKEANILLELLLLLVIQCKLFLSLLVPIIVQLGIHPAFFLFFVAGPLTRLALKLSSIALWKVRT